MKNLLLAALCAPLFFTPVFASDKVATEGAELGKWTMDYDAALKLAAEKKVPLFLNFTGSDWCGVCRIVDQRVFAQEIWQTYAEKNLVLVTLDFPQNQKLIPAKFVGRNESLAKKFEVQGFPSFVILHNDGETKMAQFGVTARETPEQFVGGVQRMIQFSEPSIEAYAKANPDKADAYRAAIAAIQKVEEEFGAWIQTRPQDTPENLKKFEEFKARMEKAGATLEEFK